MIIRRPTLSELPRLREIHEPFKNQFSFPNLELVSSIYVVVDNETIIGFGTLQPIMEATIVLDQKSKMFDRYDALSLLQCQAEKELKERGISELHIFVQVKSFWNLMKKRFGYKETKGKALVKVLR